MNLGRVAAVAACLVVAVLALPGPADALTEGVVLDLRPAAVAEPGERRAVSLVLGQTLDVQVTASNGSARPSPPIVVHLDVTDLAEETSVDPEDWTATLSQPAGVIAAGRSRTFDWTLQPVSPGTFTVYAVGLSPASDAVCASPVLTVVVVDARSLNARGILFVSIGVPALIGGLLGVRARQLRGPRGGEEPSSTR